MRRARKTKVHGRAQRRARARSRHGASDTHLLCTHTVTCSSRISDLGSYTKFTEIPVKLVTVSIPAQYFPSIHTYTGATDSLTSSDATGSYSPGPGVRRSLRRGVEEAEEVEVGRRGEYAKRGVAKAATGELSRAATGTRATLLWLWSSALVIAKGPSSGCEKANTVRLVPGSECRSECDNTGTLHAAAVAALRATGSVASSTIGEEAVGASYGAACGLGKSV